MTFRLFISSLLMLIFLSGCLSTNRWLSEETEPDEKSVRGVKVANVLFEKGDYHSAANLYAMLLKKNSANVFLLKRYAETLYNLKAYPDALDAYHLVIKQSPNSCSGLVGVGLTYLKLARPANASVYFQRCQEREPENETALLGLAISDDMSGDRHSSEIYYRKAIAANPENPKVRNNFAISLILSGNYKAAIKQLNQIAFGPKSHMQIRQNLALAYGLKGDDAAAAQVASLDLPPHAVDNNLKYYAFLRGMRENDALKAVLFPSDTAQ